MKIRKAQKKDFPEIYTLVQAAFATAEFFEGDEQDYVVELRKGATYIPQLELVAEEDGRLLGHIMLLKLAVKTPTGDFPCLLLSPLCVELSCRKRGLGAMLVNEAFSRARKMGYTAVFLAGNPHYYGRFGFKQLSLFGIKNLSPFSDEHCLACELTPGALQGVSGTVSFI